jgi:branched-chain amino acid transport system permease protein
LREICTVVRHVADFGAWYLIILGTLGIVIMLFAPRGLWGLIAERYDLTLLPTRRLLVATPDKSQSKN